MTKKKYKTKTAFDRNSVWSHHVKFSFYEIIEKITKFQIFQVQSEKRVMVVQNQHCYV